MYIAGFVKIGTGIEAMLRCCLRYLKGCEVGITYKSDLCVTPLGWAPVP
jgi:hypothetical protein